MYQPIIGTLGYLLSPDRTEVLFVHRNRRSHDQHLGKYIGLGGKMEPGEDVLTSMKREIWEEAGIVCDEIRMRGTINWPGFGPKGEHWLGFVFVIDKFSGTPPSSNEEGDLIWVPVSAILTLPMWEGDKYFLPLVFDDNPQLFHAVLPYEGGKPLHFSYTRGSHECSSSALSRLV